MTARAVAWSPGAAGPLLAEGGRWADSAACRTADPEIFFPVNGVTARARRLCGACPVRAACLEYALENRIADGVWGGAGEDERRAILASRERESGAVRCASRRHVLAGGNVLPNGKCAACRDGAIKGHEGRRIAKGLAA